ncbi:MAG: cytochrome P450 [Deltaproteobacteria bacterium]|nr:MAG: cytochrome P450 [Deltaproteobacteria bacterium]
MTHPSDPRAVDPGLLGQVWANATFLRDPLGGMERIQQRYGDVVITRFPGQTFVQVADPNLAGRVLRELRDATIKDFATRVLSEVVGNGLLTNEGDSWKRQRRLAAPPFRPKALKPYTAAMVRCASRAAESFPSGDQVDVHPPLARLTLDILAQTIFGGDLEMDAARVERHLERVMAQFYRITGSWEAVLPHRLQRTIMRQLHADRDALHQVVDTLIAQRRAQGTEGPDLLSRLIEARDDEGRGMDGAQLRDEVLTLLLAGHETTALALGYALWLLAAHPEVQTRLHTEAEAVPALNDHHDLDELPFTRAVVLESMRLYPPAWLIGRELTAPTPFAGKDLGVGTQLLVPIWLLHRDARSFPDPLTFRPDRWLDGTAEAAPKGAYLPFGGGPRICIGQHFAMIEAVLSLAVLIRQLRVSPVPGFSLELLPTVTLRPRRGILLGISRR